MDGCLDDDNPNRKHHHIRKQNKNNKKSCSSIINQSIPNYNWMWKGNFSVCREKENNFWLRFSFLVLSIMAKNILTNYYCYNLNIHTFNININDINLNAIWIFFFSFPSNLNWVYRNKKQNNDINVDVLVFWITTTTTTKNREKISLEICNRKKMKTNIDMHRVCEMWKYVSIKKISKWKKYGQNE